MNTFSRTNPKIFLIIFMSLTITYLIYSFSHNIGAIFNSFSANSNDNTFFSMIVNDNISHIENIKYIYLWNDMFDDRTWYLNRDFIGPNDFEIFKCLQTDCVVTTKKVTLLPKISMYDAILFHSARKWLNSDVIPVERNPNQVYVAVIQESPTHTSHNLELNANFFNWTLTYR